jgi:steroid delta-isomerase-like uncharacterized protein
VARTRSSKDDVTKVPEAEEPKTRTPEEVARALFDSIPKRDLDIFSEYLHPDAVDEFIVLGEVRGRDRVRAFFAELYAAFPSFEMEVERVVADERTAVVQWRAAGKFTGGPFQGIEPTGRHVDIRGVDVMEVEDGRLRHNTIYYDGASFARQIGMLPRRDSAADRGLMAAFNATTKLRSRIAARRSGS